MSDTDGRLVDLASLRARGPLVVSFNRGGWCSYCALQLRALARAHPAIVAAGADVVSIVPETQEYARELVKSRGLPFKVLVDIDLGYALSLGLVFWVGEELKDIYLKLGIDLARFQRNDGWFLPIPATFVIGRDGPCSRAFSTPTFATACRSRAYCGRWPRAAPIELVCLAARLGAAASPAVSALSYVLWPSPTPQISPPQPLAAFAAYSAWARIAPA